MASRLEVVVFGVVARSEVAASDHMCGRQKPNMAGKGSANAKTPPYCRVACLLLPEGTQPTRASPQCTSDSVEKMAETILLLWGKNDDGEIGSKRL